MKLHLVVQIHYTGETAQWKRSPCAICAVCPLNSGGLGAQSQTAYSGKFSVEFATLIIDKGVTVKVSTIIDSGISRCKIILLGTLDISSCWGVYDDMADVIVIDSGKFIANEEEP